MRTQLGHGARARGRTLYTVTVMIVFFLVKTKTTHMKYSNKSFFFLSMGGWRIQMTPSTEGVMGG